jgi:hypothetical protein
MAMPGFMCETYCLDGSPRLYTSTVADAETGYVAPTSETIAARQNQSDALRLLLAQRLLYAQAKRWAFLRAIGLGLIAILAPIVTALSPSLSVVAGSAAAFWILASRTIFVTVEKRIATRGAVVQEMFDHLIFEMPETTARAYRVTPEEIARIVGDKKKSKVRVQNERLRDWYPIDRDLPGADSIAIAQRANAAYAERLLWWNASTWLALIVGWSLVAIGISVVAGSTVGTFLVGVALPVLPPLLDTFDQWRRVRSAGKARRALAATIEDVLRDPQQETVDPQDLLVWQDQLFGLRAGAPQIPSVIYWGSRRTNERVMSEVAAELAASVKAKGVSE